MLNKCTFDNFENLPSELIIYILILAGSPQYFARFCQLSKSMGKILMNAQKTGLTQNYWRTLYDLNFKKTSSYPFLVNFQDLYRVAFEKRRKNNKKLSSKEMMLFEWIIANDLESIMKTEWNAVIFDLLRDYEKNTPISVASAMKRKKILRYFYDEICRQIILDPSKGMMVRAKSYLAASCGITSALKLDKDINEVDNLGATQLYIAAQHGHLNAVQVLVSNNANIDIACKDGSTAFSIAVENNHLDVAQYLLANNADINKARTGLTPFFIACGKGHHEITKLLLDASVDVNQICDEVTPLYIAAYKGHTKVVQTLIDAGADINLVKDDRATPLYIAACYGHDEIVKELLKAHAMINKTRSDRTSALYTAAENGHHSVLLLLIEFGADLNLAHKNGATPLFAAAYRGDLNIVLSLIKHKADVNLARTTDGAAPLHVAIQNGHLEIAHVLIKAGAELNKQRADGVAPLSLAVTYHHLSLVKEILEAGASIEPDDFTSLLTTARKNKDNEIFAFISMWQVKTKLCDRPLNEQVLAVLQTPIQVENKVIASFKLASKFFIPPSYCKLFPELKNADQEAAIAILDKNRAIIPRKQYDFIFRYILKLHNSDLNINLQFPDR